MNKKTKPEYYRAQGPLYWKLNTTIDIIDCAYIFALPPDIKNVWKYTLRAGKKDPETELEDLDKAIEYLQRRKEMLIKSKQSKQYNEGDGGLP